MVAHNTCSTHTGTSAPACGIFAVIINVFCNVFYQQDSALYWACHYGDVVKAQELLSLGANMNYHQRSKEAVSYSAYITHYSGCGGYQYTVLIQPQ